MDSRELRDRPQRPLLAMTTGTVRAAAGCIALATVALSGLSCGPHWVGILIWNKTGESLQDVRMGSTGPGRGLTLVKGGTKGHGPISSLPEEMPISWLRPSGEQVLERVAMPRLPRRFTGSVYVILRRDRVEVRLVPEQDESRVFGELSAEGTE